MSMNNLSDSPPWGDSGPSKPRGFKDTTPTTPEPGNGSSSRTTPLAFAGRRVSAANYQKEHPPVFPADTITDDYQLDQGISFSEVHSINTQINRARAALFRANSALAEANRAEAAAKMKYRHAHALALIQVSGSSEKQRTAVADLATEEEYANLIVAEKISEEMLSQVRALRTELDALFNISHNLRAQMNLA